MNSIGFVVAWLAGCSLGLLLMDRYPSGLDSRYGLALFAFGLLLVAPMRIAWEDKRARWLCLFLLAGLCGFGRALLIHPPVTQSDLAFYNAIPKSAQVRVIGTVAEQPVLLDRWQRMRVSAEQVFLPGDMQAKQISGICCFSCLAIRLMAWASVSPSPGQSGLLHKSLGSTTRLTLRARVSTRIWHSQGRGSWSRSEPLAEPTCRCSAQKRHTRP